MDPQEEFMMWILPQILAEEEESEGQPSTPPPHQVSDANRVGLKVLLVTMACFLLLCLILALKGG